MWITSLRACFVASEGEEVEGIYWIGSCGERCSFPEADEETKGQFWVCFLACQFLSSFYLGSFLSEELIVGAFFL